MAKTKMITIGDERFELCGTTSGSKKFYAGAAYDEIYEVYGRPSDTKVAIWHDWCKWAYKNDAELSISGHSCMFFSISGKVAVGDKVYALYITAAHNRAYEIV